ncbi:DUF2268 domain-containing protein [Sporosarcina aquimarina]|uniref:DUF2268 domain-containing protein n=1 Tax=Sporosarcina aquimarina TaxID=114975 RepID=UPI00203B89FE|nr:DUF2268 domain-containing putative Zn-dependent protease [Sporosarcina aquimarina]MCM3757373.1 DUF2268 domain-containing protein [Sporosarcina aquimarina]
MRIIVLLFCALATLTLFGCSEIEEKTKHPNAEEKEVAEQEELHTDTEKTTSSLKVPDGETFLYNGQVFQIIYFYKPFLDYIEQAEAQPDHLDDLFLETVVDPMAGGNGQALLKQYYLSTPMRPALLEEYLQSLSDNQEIIHTLIVDALKESADRLQPGVSKYVYVLPANPDDAFTMKKMDGVTGVAFDENTVLLQIAPPFLTDAPLKHTVAHEYHHSVLKEKSEVSTGNTLLDFVLIEGKADTFARILYPNVRTGYSDFSTDTDEKDTWTVLKDQKASTDPVLQQLFFHGDGSKGLPRWANYKIGNKIMDRFIQENPDVSIVEWTNMPSEEILEKSEYGDMQ